MLLLSIVTDLRELLSTLYTEMAPLSAGLTGPARVIAGLGAAFYLGYRLLGHLARAESLDVLPLLRPFVLLLVIVHYSSFISLIDTTLSPVVASTESMHKSQSEVIDKLIQKKEKMLASRPENKKFEDKKEFQKELDKLGITDVGETIGLYLNKAAYDFRKNFRLWIKGILELIFHAVSLGIIAVMTLQLVVLNITGPITIGISAVPGLGSSLTNWLNKYISTSMWLPMSNIVGSMLGKIQVLMLERDIASIQANDAAGLAAADYGMMLFLLLGTGSLLFVPAMAGMVVAGSGMAALAGMATSSVGSALSGGSDLMNKGLKAAGGGGNSSNSPSLTEKLGGKGLELGSKLGGNIGDSISKTAAKMGLGGQITDMNKLGIGDTKIKNDMMSNPNHSAWGDGMKTGTSGATNPNLSLDLDAKSIAQDSPYDWASEGEGANPLNVQDASAPPATYDLSGESSPNYENSNQGQGQGKDQNQNPYDLQDANAESSPTSPAAGLSATGASEDLRGNSVSSSPSPSPSPSSSSSSNLPSPFDWGDD